MSSTTANTRTDCHTHVIGVSCFAGIRYALPPTGDLRFAPPQAAKTMNVTPGTAGIRGPIAMQSPSRLSSVMGDYQVPQSEDCLNLTVWTPARDKASRPVLFWIHGGAFLSGGGALDWYDAATLCREGNIVVVSPNYRLGAFGFLHHPEVAPGNLGLLDLELALSWVRDNIADFGGDPGQVSAMGQSAGAWSAALLAGRMAPDAPTIHRLILHSAPLGITPVTPDTANRVAERFLHALAASAATPLGADAETILAAQGTAMRDIGTSLTEAGHPAVPFGPVSDGVVVAELADYARSLTEAAGRLPVLIGWTRDEMHAFHRPDGDAGVVDNNHRLGSEIFSEPALRWATDACARGQDAFVYCFDWSPLGSDFGACHCIDLPFLFGNLDAFAAAPMLKSASASAMGNLSRQMRTAWLSFICHGDPTPSQKNGLPFWPRFEPVQAPVMHIDVTSKTIQATTRQLQESSQHA